MTTHREPTTPAIIGESVGTNKTHFFSLVYTTYGAVLRGQENYVSVFVGRFLIQVLFSGVARFQGVMTLLFLFRMP